MGVMEDFDDVPSLADPYQSAYDRRTCNESLKDCRRTKAIKLHILGHPMVEIAQMLGVTRQTISKDISEIRSEWQKQRIEDFTYHVDLELQRINLVFQEAYAAWCASVGEKVKVTVKQGDDSGETITTTEISAGDARLLQVMLSCIDKRAKLLGLDAPSKLEIIKDEELKTYSGAHRYLERMEKILFQRSGVPANTDGAGDASLN